MLFNRFMKVVVMVFAVCLLTACSHAGSESSGSASVSADDAAAQVYGVGQGVGSTAANGMHINAMTAPSNQVYYFAFDSNSMSDQDLRALEIQANYLASHPNAKIRLEGNTDDRGSREYNVGLGWRRDQAVARYIEQQGVSPSQIQMLSYGKEHPAAYGENEQSWALNRRVELIYKAD